MTELSPLAPARTSKALVLVVLVALLMLGVLAAQFIQILSEAERMTEFRERLDQSVETRANLRNIFSTLQDAIAGERGFALTGDPEFLGPYETAARRLPALFDDLRDLTEGTPRHPDAVRLEELGRTELSVLARTIDASRQSGLATAVEIVRDKRSQQQMDQIRTVVERLVEAETRDVAHYSAAFRQQVARFERIGLGLAGAITLVVLAAAAAACWYIVHRSRSEAELGQARGRAEAASRAKTDFLASMSHEIRTPLNGIIGYTDLLMDQDLRSEQRRIVERIQFAGASLLTVVNDILDFSKIEANQITLQPRPFSLKALLDNTISIVAEFAERKGLILEVDTDPQLSKVLIGDEARLRQVLLNLLNNAVKFTRIGSVRLEVRCRSSESCDTIRFAVSDTGDGIRRDLHQNLFQRFYQVNQSSTREFGGTGLGLAISKKLVQLMGGEIGVESEEGKGSTFWFWVPLSRADDGAIARQHAASIPQTGVTGRILLVEDLEHNRDLARAILVAAGHDVDAAENGAEAVQAVQATLYNLVLMDIQMPVMDGITATQKIRELSHPCNAIPIIAMTANVLPQQVKEFGEAGMNDHVGKPFKRAELLRKVNVWLQRAGADQQPGQAPAAPAEAALSDEDPDVNALLDELCEFMGRDWVASGLWKLKKEITETFGSETDVLADPQALARRAHQLVSHAAMLGFPDLSRLCSELEEACRSGQDVPLQFRQAQAAAQMADERANKGLARIEASAAGVV
ncbi:ATP-binding protein [Microvirga yunnanensis]|uniref:ATP-binding protein n=1 Tax=Microvirga yunnanensis TaxID=2953740 RepID=UPI0021C961B2|nr:ATP-binding protein [Microvirga sp. HBU65207]